MTAGSTVRALGPQDLHLSCSRAPGSAGTGQKQWGAQRKEAIVPSSPCSLPELLIIVLKMFLLGSLVAAWDIARPSCYLFIFLKIPFSYTVFAGTCVSLFNLLVLSNEITITVLISKCSLFCGYLSVNVQI